MNRATLTAAAIVAAVAVTAAAAGWFYTPAPAAAVVTKPIPKVAPMDMKRFFEQSEYGQRQKDFQDLGKYGPAHDAWILKHYRKAPPSLEPPRPPPPPRRVPARQPNAREA